MVATFTKNNLRDDEEYITIFGVMTRDNDNDFMTEDVYHKEDYYWDPVLKKTVYDPKGTKRIKCYEELAKNETDEKKKTKLESIVKKFKENLEAKNNGTKSNENEKTKETETKKKETTPNETNANEEPQTKEETKEQNKKSEESKNKSDKGSKTEKSDETKQSTTKIERHTNSSLYKSIGDEHYNNLHKALDTSPEHIKKLWNKMEEGISIINTDETAQTGYERGNGIRFNLNDTIKGSPTKEPYEVLFHEIGHNIDYILKDVSTRKEVIKGIKSDATNFINKMTKEIQDVYNEGGFEKLRAKSWLDYKTSLMYRNKPSEFILNKSNINKIIKERLMFEIHSKDSSTISDVLGALTNNKLAFSSYHRTEYWNFSDEYWLTDKERKKKKMDLISKEFFAGAFGSITMNPKSYNKLKEIFPIACAKFEEIVKEASK